MSEMNESNNVRFVEAINKLAKGMAQSLLISAARKAGRKDVQYINTGDKNSEMYVTVSLKPDTNGNYLVLRKGTYIYVPANKIESTDDLGVSFSFEIYAETTTNVGRVLRQISKGTIKKFYAFIPATNEREIELRLMEFNRKDEMFQAFHLPNKVNRTDFTEDDMLVIVAEKLTAFVNRLYNNNAEIMARLPEHNGKITLYGQYKAQQKAV